MAAVGRRLAPDSSRASVSVTERVDGPAPPAEILLQTASTLAVRVKGKPRSPGTGHHRELVIFTEPTMTPPKLAVRLRDAADRLDPPRLSAS